MLCHTTKPQWEPFSPRCEQPAKILFNGQLRSGTFWMTKAPLSGVKQIQHFVVRTSLPLVKRGSVMVWGCFAASGFGQHCSTTCQAQRGDEALSRLDLKATANQEPFSLLCLCYTSTTGLSGKWLIQIIYYLLSLAIMKWPSCKLVVSSPVLATLFCLKCLALSLIFWL